MSGPFSDCYVVAPSRCSADALLFLENFMPDCTPQWDESDPPDVLGTSTGLSLPELTQFLEGHPELSYTMYFRNNQDGAPYFAILIYCHDGALIFGLSGDESATSSATLLNRLEAFAGAKGYWCLEEAPVDSRREFASRVGQCA